MPTPTPTPTPTTRSTKTSSGATRHRPQRTCIACRETRPQSELLRVVRTPAGGVHVDERERSPGRGAYLCDRAACWERALVAQRGGVLAQALRAPLDQPSLRQLLAYAARRFELQPAALAGSGEAR